AHFWRKRRAICRRYHLSRPSCCDQFDDADWTTRDHVDGRRSLVAAMAWWQKSTWDPDKCHSPATAIRECTFTHPTLRRRGPLHAIQFAALLVACCARRDRASFHAS